MSTVVILVGGIMATYFLFYFSVLAKYITINVSLQGREKTHNKYFYKAIFSQSCFLQDKV